jgi:hypothetical protein
LRRLLLVSIVSRWILSTFGLINYRFCAEPAWRQRQAEFLIRERKIVTPPAATTTLRTALLVRRMVQIAVFVEATVKPIAAQVRHREERSDAAVHVGLKLWIAAACGLAMTGLGFCRVFLRIEFFALNSFNSVF